MSKNISQNNYKVTDRGVWTRFINTAKAADIPKYLLLFYIFLTIIEGQILIRIPEVNGNFFAGDVSTRSVALFLGLEILNMIVCQFVLYVNHILRYKTNRNLRNQLWSKVLRLKPSYYDKVSPSSLNSRITKDADSFNTFILDVVIEMGAQIYYLVLTVREMSKVSVKIGFLLLAFTPITFVITFVVGRINMRFENRIRASLSDFTTYLSEIISVLPLLKALNRQEYETKRGKDVIDAYYVANRKVVVLTVITDLIHSIAGIGPELVIFLFGIKYLNDGTFDAETWYIFYIYAGTFIGFCGTLSSMWTETKTIQGSLYRISEIMDEESESLETYVEDIVESGDILFDNVSFAYDETPIVENASFTIKSKQLNMLIGCSGAGKSTTLKLLERLYEPDKGRILMAGKDIAEHSIRDWRANVAYVSQSTPLFSGSIRENLLYGIKTPVSDEELKRVCHMTRLSTLVNTLEEGLNYEVGEFGEKLSGGQKQKISVARALLSQAEILILDEPTASLDIISTHDIMETLESLKGERTVVVISHDREVIDKAEHIIVINQDHTIDEGTKSEIAKINDFYIEMMNRKDGDE